MPFSTPNTQPRLLLTTQEAAQALAVSTRTLWNLTAPRGPIPAVRLDGSRAVRYSLAALEGWIAGREAAGVLEADTEPATPAEGPARETKSDLE
jgi:excisionase family DNA binding protein